MQNQYDSSNKIKLSVIATVKNEAGTITSFIESLLNQSFKPDYCKYNQNERYNRV